MELHAHDVAALDGRGEGLDVVRDGGRVGRDRRLVGMREVDKFAGFDSGQQARGRAHVERIPAYMGNLFVAFGEAGALIRKMRQPGLIGCFSRTRIEPLHADADAEERNAARDGGADRRGEAGFVEALGRGEMADAGQDEALGGFDERQISVGDFDSAPRWRKALSTEVRLPAL